jgi:hypothetical protein
METDFMASFATLLAHWYHNPKIKVVISNYELEWIDPDMIKALDSNVEAVISIVINSSHFAVLHVNIAAKVVYIIEGLDSTRDIRRWMNHVLRVLIRTGLVPLDTKLEAATDSIGGFRLEHKRFSVQRNGYDCAPIGGATVWEILSDGEFQANNYSHDQLRPLIVDKYAAMIQEFKKELLVSKIIGLYELIEHGTASNINDGNQWTNNDNTCCFCYEVHTPSTSVKGPECGHRFHCHCLLDWFDSSRSCPMCRVTLNPVDILSQLGDIE